MIIDEKDFKDPLNIYFFYKMNISGMTWTNVARFAYAYPMCNKVFKTLVENHGKIIGYVNNERDEFIGQQVAIDPDAEPEVIQEPDLKDPSVGWGLKQPDLGKAKKEPIRDRRSISMVSIQLFKECVQNQFIKTYLKHLGNLLKTSGKVEGLPSILGLNLDNIINYHLSRNYKIEIPERSEQNPIEKFARARTHALQLLRDGRELSNYDELSLTFKGNPNYNTTGYQDVVISNPESFEMFVELEYLQDKNTQKSDKEKVFEVYTKDQYLKKYGKLDLADYLTKMTKLPVSQKNEMIVKIYDGFTQDRLDPEILDKMKNELTKDNLRIEELKKLTKNYKVKSKPDREKLEIKHPEISTISPDLFIPAIYLTFEDLFMLYGKTKVDISNHDLNILSSLLSDTTQRYYNLNLLIGLKKGLIEKFKDVKLMDLLKSTKGDISFRSDDLLFGQNSEGKGGNLVGELLMDIRKQDRKIPDYFPEDPKELDTLNDSATRYWLDGKIIDIKNNLSSLGRYLSKIFDQEVIISKEVIDKMFSSLYHNCDYSDNSSEKIVTKIEYISPEGIESVNSFIVSLKDLVLDTAYHHKMLATQVISESRDDIDLVEFVPVLAVSNLLKFFKWVFDKVKKDLGLKKNFTFNNDVCILIAEFLHTRYRKEKSEVDNPLPKFVINLSEKQIKRMNGLLEVIESKGDKHLVRYFSN